MAKEQSSKASKKAIPKPKEEVDKKDSSAQKNQMDDDITDEIPEEILDAIPEEDRHKVISIIKRSVWASVTRSAHPLMEKITPEHVGTLINNSDVQDKRDREERGKVRLFNLLILILILGFLVFIIIFLVENENLLNLIITAALAFAGGFGLGKFYKRSNEE